MSDGSSGYELLHPDVLRRYRNSAAFDHGTTAFRQGQPLTDNPYHRTGQRDEWHAWVDGWALVRNAVERERARAEWAEQACRDAMAEGLQQCAKLRRTIAIHETMNRYSGLMDRLADDWYETRLLDTLAATCNERDALRVQVAMLEAETRRLRAAVEIMSLPGDAIGYNVLDPQEGTAEERCQQAFRAAKDLADVHAVARRGGSIEEMWAVCGWSGEPPNGWWDDVPTLQTRDPDELFSNAEELPSQNGANK